MFYLMINNGKKVRKSEEISLVLGEVFTMGR